jgi:hypothetical protein
MHISMTLWKDREKRGIIMMNTVVTMVMVAMVAMVVGFVVTQCNCKHIKNGEVVVEAFFPWTFDKKVKEYYANIDFERKAEAKKADETRAARERINTRKKMAEMVEIELGNDAEENEIIRTYNEIVFRYANSNNIDVEYFKYLQSIARQNCYTRLNNLVLARKNHEKIMEFHCS